MKYFFKLISRKSEISELINKKVVPLVHLEMLLIVARLKKLQEGYNFSKVTKLFQQLFLKELSPICGVRL